MKESKTLEQNFLAQVIAQPSTLGYVKAASAFLTADDFVSDRHADVWSHLLQLASHDIETDMVNIFNAYASEGIKWDVLPYLPKNDIQGDILTIAATIHELGVRRRLVEDATKVIVGVESGILTAGEAAESLNEATAEALNQNTRKYSTMQELYKQAVKTLEDKANGVAPMSWDCGIWLLDNQQTIADGSLLVVAGRTSNGKTALALNIALGLAKQGTPTAVYSLEMTNLQVSYRLISNVCEIDAESMRRADLTAKQWERITKCDASLPMYFDDCRENNREAIFASIRNLVDTKGIKVVFLDYLQLIKGKGKDRRLDVGDIANDLKVLAVQMHICIVLLSQLSRGATPEPKLSELKESGDIENAADAVYLIYRPEQHGNDAAFPNLISEWSQYSTKDNALLICAKNRLGRCGEQLLGWDGALQRFYQRTTYELRQPSAADFTPINNASPF